MSEMQLSTLDQQRSHNCIVVVKRYLDNNEELKAWSWYASMLKAFAKELESGVQIPPFPGSASLQETMTLLPQKLLNGTVRAITADYCDPDNIRARDAKSKYDSCVSLLQALAPDSLHLLPPFDEIIATHCTPEPSKALPTPKSISDEKLARRLARVAADDIRIYNPELIMRGIVEHNIFELLHEHIEEARKEFNKRVTPEIVASNIFDFALIDVLIHRAYKNKKDI